MRTWPRAEAWSLRQVPAPACHARSGREQSAPRKVASPHPRGHSAHAAPRSPVVTLSLLRVKIGTPLDQIRVSEATWRGQKGVLEDTEVRTGAGKVPTPVKHRLGAERIRRGAVTASALRRTASQGPCRGAASSRAQEPPPPARSKSARSCSVDCPHRSSRPTRYE
jgi:hypothetical protein